MTTRTYKTADEALEAANKEIAQLQYEWDMQRYSAFGVPIDKSRLNKPKQFAYEKDEHADWPETLKPDWEAVGVELDGSIAPVDKLSYMQPFNPDPIYVIPSVTINSSDE